MRLAETLAEPAGRSREWKEVLEGWNVERSTLLMERENKAELRRNRKALLRVAEARLEQPIPDDLYKLIELQEDMAVLDDWLSRVAVNSTLDELRRIVQ